MATSEGAGARILDYLGSTPNIVGSVAGLAALGATVPTGVAGPLWPVVVAGVYGIGALLTPKPSASFVADGYSSALAQAGELRGQLDALTKKVHRYGKQLPDDVLAAYARIEVALRELLDRAQALATAPEQLYLVGRIITDYLPTSLQAYANLPRTYAMRHRTEGRRTAHEELLHQLGLLEEQIAQIATAVYAGDSAALRSQGRFLEDRFTRSELDLS